MPHAGTMVLFKIKKNGTGSSYAQRQILYSKALERLRSELLLEFVIAGLMHKSPLIHWGEIVSGSKTVLEAVYITPLYNNLLGGKI